MSSRLVWLVVVSSATACNSGSQANTASATGSSASTSGGSTTGRMSGSGSSTGGGNSLNGLLAVSFGVVIAAEKQLGDGGHDPSSAALGFFDSNPSYNCAAINSFPDSGTILGAVQILISAANGAQIAPGSIAISPTRPPDAGQFASLFVLGPTNPPGPMAANLAGAISGELRLDTVDPSWSGTFTATVLQLDGGRSTLSGQFDTSIVCLTP